MHVSSGDDDNDVDQQQQQQSLSPGDETEVPLEARRHRLLQATAIASATAVAAPRPFFSDVCGTARDVVEREQWNDVDDDAIDVESRSCIQPIVTFVPPQDGLQAASQPSRDRVLVTGRYRGYETEIRESDDKKKNETENCIRKETTRLTSTKTSSSPPPSSSSFKKNNQAELSSRRLSPMEPLRASSP